MVKGIQVRRDTLTTLDMVMCALIDTLYSYDIATKCADWLFWRITKRHVKELRPREVHINRNTRTITFVY